MLILHQFHLSPFNEKVQRLLNYKGVPFEEKYWRIADRGKILKISPTGKLPALEHDGRIVCDSTDMVHYIEGAFPSRPLVPAHPKLAGMVHILEDWADESLYFYEMQLRFCTPGNQQRNVPRLIANEPPIIRWLLTRLLPRVLRKTTASQGVGRKSQDQLLVDAERHVAAVAGLLEEDEWLLANRITLADLAVYAMLQCFRDADTAMALLSKYPKVTGWLERVEANTSTRASSPEGGQAT